MFEAFYGVSVSSSLCSGDSCFEYFMTLGFEAVPLIGLTLHSVIVCDMIIYKVGKPIDLPSPNYFIFDQLSAHCVTLHNFYGM